MRTLFLLAYVIACSYVTPSHAADIALAPPGAPCMITLSGPIKAGDAARLNALIPDAQKRRASSMGSSAREQVTRRICLESPGGALAEGVELARLFRRHVLGTIIPRNATCLSACAVAFMGGAAYDDPTVPPFPDRVMHPTARLGFHAPALSVPKGRYGADTVSDAYATALASMSILLRDLDNFAFPLSLAAIMLDTPPETFTAITTVAQAARLGIAVAPIKAPAELTLMTANLACSYAQSYALDEAFTYLENVSRLEPDSDGRLSQTQEMLNYGADGLSGCELWYWPAGDEHSYSHLPTSFAGRIELMSNAPPLSLVMFWPPDTPLRSLALADDAVAEVAAPDLITTQTETTAFCLTFNEAPTLLASVPCRILTTETWTHKGSYTRDQRLIAGNEELIRHHQSVIQTPISGETFTETIDDAPIAQDWNDYGQGSAYRDRLYPFIDDAEKAFAQPTTECWPKGSSKAVCAIQEL